jgi:two-component system, sensor histidine kinase
MDEKRKNQTLKLSAKMVTLVIVVSSLVSIFTTAIQLTWDFNVDRSKIDTTLDSVQVSYLEPLEKSVWNFDSAQIKSTLRGIKNLEDIEYLKLVMDEETFELGESSSGQKVSKLFQLQSPALEGEKIRSLGSLYVVASLEGVYAKLYNRIFVVLISNMVKTFFVSFFILILLHRVVTRHLGQMVSYFEGLDYSKSVEALKLSRTTEPMAHRRDELDQLADSITGSASRLNESRLLVESELAQRRNAEKELQDVNARLKNETKIAKKATKVTKDFLAQMSHEIRNPLGSILGLNSILLDSSLTETQKDHLKTIGEAGNTLKVILDDILDLSKMDSGSFHLINKPMEIRKCVESSAHLLENETKSRNLKFNIDVSSSCPKIILSDVARISQVLNNLLSNAVKFSENSDIDITLTAAPNPKQAKQTLIEFCIKDRGIGIPEQDRENLFKEYTQSSNNKTGKGLGLGLMIARSLANLLGGDIWAESKVGVGSSFYFTISTIEMGVSSILKENKKLSELAPEFAEKLNVLVVDDEKTNRFINSAFLKKLGVIADTAENGEIAVRMNQEKNYD